MYVVYQQIYSGKICFIIYY